MRENNKILLVSVIAVLLIGVAVVVFVTRGNNDSRSVVTQPAVVEEVAVADPELESTEVQQTIEPTQSEVVEEQIVPTPRTGLESTDPATVNLATGEIQLIEAFAFW